MISLQILTPEKKAILIKSYLTAFLFVKACALLFILFVIGMTIFAIKTM